MSTIDDVSRFVFSTLFFPKKVLIDRPGIIVNKIMQKYSGLNSQHRAVFFFEEIMSGLQNESIKKLGRDKAKALWYKTGKDVAARYLVLGNAKKMPSFLQKITIEYVLSGFRAAGQTFALKTNFNSSDKSFVVTGNNNLVCRKTNLGDFSSGLVSGIVSFFTGENIEAETICNCPNCKIIANKKIQKKYILNIDFVRPDKYYFSLNFPKFISNSSGSGSFKDFIKFRKIVVDIDSKFTYKGHALALGEIGLFHIIARNYIDALSKKSFDDVVLKASINIAKDMFAKKINESDKIDEIFKMLSAVGYGNFFFRKNLKKITVINKWVPYYDGIFYYQQLMLCGFLNAATNHKWSILEVSFEKKESTLKIVLEKR